MEDDTPIYDVLFQLEINLCERFPAFTPLSLRREKAREVFTMVMRFNNYNKNEKKTEGKPKVIRRRASDDAGWW